MPEIIFFPKSLKLQQQQKLHISSIYAKILGETNFLSREIPEVGQKQKTEKRVEKRRRAKVGNNNGQLRIATPPRVVHAKLPGPK